MERLTWKEDNVNLSSLIKNEVGATRKLMQHIECLKQEGDFPSEASNFRHNTITRVIYINFKGSSMSSRDLCTNPSPGLAGSSESPGRHSQQLTPVESFKRVIKRN